MYEKEEGVRREEGRGRENTSSSAFRTDTSRWWELFWSKKIIIIELRFQY
jgi:hypothetical protein